MNTIGKYGIKNLIFSSTAAVYGYPTYLPLDENHSLAPINFYGYTKLVIEDLIKWYGKLGIINYVIFRFFNAAGYDINGRVKCVEQNPNNLLPIIMETANKTRKKMKVYGDTYDTNDGTCVRDYIHVNDLATAHVQAMNHISNTKEDIVVNLATGDGHSVLDVIHKAIEVSGNNIPYDIVERRTGDPGTVLAVSKKAFKLLNWTPGYSDLDTLIRSAWEVYR